MRAEIDACHQSLIGWGQYGTEELGRAVGRHRGTSGHQMFCFSALPCCPPAKPQPTSPALWAGN